MGGGWGERFALALLLSSMSCTCGGRPGRNPEEFIDKDATFVLSVPSLGTLADHVDALKATARAGGNTKVVEWLANLAG